jgi:hypothetical protein
MAKATRVHSTPRRTAPQNPDQKTATEQRCIAARNINGRRDCKGAMRREKFMGRAISCLRHCKICRVHGEGSARLESARPRKAGAVMSERKSHSKSFPKRSCLARPGLGL